MKDITIWITLYVALVSTVSLGWNIYNTIRDRSKVRVKVSRGQMLLGHRITNELHIAIIAINCGRRPITLTEAGIRLKDGRDFRRIVEGEFPVRLEEGQSHQSLIPLREISEDERKLARFAWMHDATGRFYKAKVKKDILIQQ